MDVPLWAWVAVSTVIVAVLLVDLLVLHREAHEVSVREALRYHHNDFVAIAERSVVVGYEAVLGAVEITP